MPYDLYGNSYRTAREAEIAEMAQCAEIDSRLADKRISDLERQLSYQQQPGPDDERIYNLEQHCQSLEQRISELEKVIQSIY